QTRRRHGRAGLRRRPGLRRGGGTHPRVRATQTALAIDRKRAQQALQESEHKFRALFEGSSQGVMIQDEGKFLEVNSATLRILGFDSPAAILGKHPKDTSPPFQPNGERSETAA